MDVTCSRCGGTFPQTEVDDRFQGVCPMCLAKALLEEGSTGDASSHEDPPLAPGRAIGGYEIVEPLGAGGMGVVYKARQPHLDRLVALKVLPRRLAEQPDFEERFRREAKALASLSHSNIVGVHDYGVSGGVTYLVMEFVDGVDLRSVLREKRLTPEEAIRIVPQLCDALEYAHGEGIVHRDIKPENILIDRKGRVKIADFGLAKLLRGEGAERSITQTQAVMGTPSYMAPEQVEDPKRVDHRADIYSMGVVFYEMLTGELPLGSFAPPSQKVRVDVRLDEVVLKTLAKEPERRYQHASEVKEDVTQMTRIAPPRPPVLRRRSPLRATAWIVLLLGLALCILFGYRRMRPAESRQAAEPVAPAWFDRIVPTDDELPGDYTFASPQGAIRAETPPEVSKALGALRKAGVAWHAEPEVHRACLVLLKDDQDEDVDAGFAALVTEGSEPAKRCLATFAPPDGGRLWTHQDGATLVVAFCGAYDPAFEQMVNGLCARIGRPLPFVPFSVSRARLGEDELPVGCYLICEAARPDAPEFLEAPMVAEVGIDPGDVAAVSYQRIGPSDVHVIAMGIPRASVRRKVHSSLRGPRPGWVSEQCEGPAIVLVVTATEGEQARFDAGEVADLVRQHRSGSPPSMEGHRRVLEWMELTDVKQAAEIVARGPSPLPRPEADVTLTGLVLAGRGDRDVEWAAGQNPRTLFEELKRTAYPGDPDDDSGYPGKLSLLQPSYLRTVTEDTADIEVPGCMRLSIGIGRAAHGVSEIRLPRSGLRLCIESQWAWHVLPLGEAFPALQDLHIDPWTLRTVARDTARATGRNYVIAPTIRGEKAPWTPPEPLESLRTLLRSAGFAYDRRIPNILRIGTADQLATLKRAPRSSVLPAVDESTPRVTIDVLAGSLRETALRAAAVGGVTLDFSPEVKGKLTARLIDVPWPDALEALVTTCSYELSRAPSGAIRVAASSTPPSSALASLRFRAEDLPQGWRSDTSSVILKRAGWTFQAKEPLPLPCWATMEEDIGPLLAAAPELAGLTSQDVFELYLAAFFQVEREKGQRLLAWIILLDFQDEAAALRIESRSASAPTWGGARKQVALRQGRTLALGLLCEGQEAEFDALMAKLRERMGLKEK